MQSTPKASKKASSEVPRKLSPRANSSEVAQKISPRAVSEETARKTSPRAVSLEVARKTSPRAVSSEVARKTSPQAVSSEVAQKISPRPVRKLNNTTGLESGSTSSLSQSSRTPRKTSPKVLERQTPKSPVPEIEKRRGGKVAELESQISQLQEDLKGVKDQLNSTNASKNQADQEATESKKQLLAVSSKLEESKLQESCVMETQNLSQELKAQIEMVAESEAKQRNQAESANAELCSLKESLKETIFFVDDLKKRIEHCKESEDKANALVGETMMQLETVKMTVDTLKMDGAKATEAYEALAFELDQSRAHVHLLEGIVDKLKAETDDKMVDDEIGEVNSVKYEIGQLSLALESADMRYQEEGIRRTVEIGCVYEFVEEIKSKSSIREVEIEVEIKKARAYVEELKADMMDEESQLARSNESENKLENELKKNKEEIKNLEASIMEKETEFHNMLDENGTLKLEMKRDGAEDVAFTELEAARAAEEQARAKLADVAEEAEKSKKRETRVAEQLAAARVANAETEVELRQLRVQSDQWRKAAEAAAAVISTGNNGKFVERTGSMDSNYDSVVKGKIGLPYFDELEGDFGKKKNGNVLKRIGVFWKKQQK